MAARILSDLLRLTIPPLLLGIGTAAVLLVAEIYIPAGTWRWMPIPLQHLDDRDSYATFLSTISGIGGVLIGLYYAGLTAVSSSAYVQAPGILRILLLREPVGSLYIKLLAYTTFLSLCLLAFFAVGISPIRFAVPFLIVLSGVTILSFVQLGQHAFYFLDPSRLAGSVFADLDRWVRRATVRSRFWADPTFQEHAHGQADSALKSLLAIAEYSSSQKYLKTAAVADLAGESISFLYHYADERQLIPSESKWYPSEYQHPDFYAAGELKAQLAVQTGTSVQPIPLAKSHWLEQAALPVVSQALRSNLDQNNEAPVFRLLDMLRSYVEKLGQLWEVDQAVNFIVEVEKTIRDFALSPESARQDAPYWRLGLVEYLCLLPISVLLGFVKSIEGASPAAIEAQLAKVTWDKPKTIYESGFRLFALPTLEWFSPRMQFEAAADGGTISPSWLVLQAVSKDYLTELHKTVNLLLDASDSMYDSWYKRADASGHRWAAAVILNRQQEYIAKMQTHFRKVVDCEGGLQGVKVLKDMVGWPKLLAKEMEDRLAGISRKHAITTALEAQRLVGEKRRPQVPDFPGEFLSRTAFAILGAIVRNDSDAFTALFPPFFNASIRKMTVLFGSGSPETDHDQMQHANMAIGPLLDLVELSGDAIIASELRESQDMWQTARDLWNAYLDDAQVGIIRSGFISSALQNANVPGLFAAGEIVRTNWRMSIQSMLSTVPRRRAVSGSGSFGLFTEQRVQHDSPLIRVLARQTLGGFYRGIDVFAVIYFAKRSGNEQVLGEFHARELAQALERESRLAEDKDEEEEE